jgi:hypothetical protein
MYAPYVKIFGDFPASNTVYAAYIWPTLRMYMCKALANPTGSHMVINFHSN